MLKSITPCFWFDREAEEAARHYVAIFPDSGIDAVSHYDEGAHMPAGTALTVSFHLWGQPFMAFNSTPRPAFNEAASLVVGCQTQDELDRYWERLCEGGQPVQCGWLKDRYGLFWQIVPSIVPRVLTGPDRAAAGRLFKALTGMVKLDIAELERAARG